MTIFGIDISRYQTGINLAKVKQEGFDFCIAKCTEKASVVNLDYHRQRIQAINADMLFACYHFLRHHTTASISSQVSWLKKNIGDTRIPVAVDSELSSADGKRPTDQDVKDFITLARKAGLKVTMLYMAGATFLPSGCIKWHAHYGNQPRGYASEIYEKLGGDDSDHWKTSIPTTLWQFSQYAKLSSWSSLVDANAYRGTLAQLKALKVFYDPNPQTIPTPETSTIIGSDPAIMADIFPLKIYQVKGQAPIYAGYPVNGVYKGVHIMNSFTLAEGQAKGVYEKTITFITAAQMKELTEPEKSVS